MSKRYCLQIDCVVSKGKIETLMFSDSYSTTTFKTDDYDPEKFDDTVAEQVCKLLNSVKRAYKDK